MDMKLVRMAGIWLVLLTVALLGYKFVFKPKAEASREQAAKDEKEKILKSTSADVRYKTTINLALDSFSGYCILRSDSFRKELAEKGIKLNILSDNADYPGRMKKLQSGEVQFAAFTYDALAKASAVMGELPATSIYDIDRSNGCDLMVGAKRLGGIDALNDPEARMVLVWDSPSEMLARVVKRNFSLDRMVTDPFIKVGSPQEVIAAYKNSKPTDKVVFVGWYPEMSEITDNPEYHDMINTSKFPDYVADCLVEGRDFLMKNPEISGTVLECYSRAAFLEKDRMEQLVMEDASAQGIKLTPDKVKLIVKGIHWQNTQENYARFGIAPRPGYERLDDTITKIIDLLVKTGAIQKDPTGGSPNYLYYDKLLKTMFDAGFHPGTETLRTKEDLRELTDKEWESLVPVGTLDVPPLVFRRGSAELTPPAEANLAELVERLKSWPQFYILVRGHTQGETTPASLVLQKQRAEAAGKWLVEHGVSAKRIRAEASESNGSTTVKFKLGQLPF